MFNPLLNTSARATDANGVVLPGAIWRFYVTGTLTPQAVYSDKTLATSLGSSVVADAGGKFPNIFFDGSKTYRGVLKNASGSLTIYDTDPINQSSIASGISKTPSGTLQDTATVVDALGTAIGATLVSVTDPGAGAVTRPIATVLSEAPINLHNYYSASDGANWAPALTKAIAQMAASRRAIYVPPPTGGLTYYPMTANVTIDMLPFFNTGFVIFGSGQQKSSFDFRGLGLNNFNIRCSGGVSPPGAPASSVYPKISDIGMIGDGPGPVLTVGNPDLSDQINELKLLDVSVQNFNTTSTSVGAQYNNVYNAHTRAVINCGSGGYVGGQGSAVQLISTAFSSFEGSYGSAQSSFLFTGSAAPQSGFTYGNTFTACDMENVSYCVINSHVNATRNTFIGGQFSYSSNAIHSPVGTGRTLLVNPNPNPAGGGALAFFVGSIGGVLIKGAGWVPPLLPTLAASTVAMTNVTGMDLFMFSNGGAVTAINRNGSGAVATTSNTMEFWPAGETRALTYSTAPTLSFSVCG
jgi:hypothetical protein